MPDDDDDEHNDENVKQHGDDDGNGGDDDDSCGDITDSAEGYEENVPKNLQKFSLLPTRG